MDLTPNFGLGKPVPGENYDISVHNTNADIVDSQLKTRQDFDTDFTAWQNDVNDFRNGNGTWGIAEVTNALTAASGFSIVEQKLLHWGPVVFIKAIFNRTGGTIASNADGNIVNVALATFGASWRPWGGHQVGGVSSYGGPVYGTFLDNAGISLNALPPNHDLIAGDDIYTSFMYFRDIA